MKLSGQTIFAIGDQVDWADQEGELMRLFGGGPFTVIDILSLPIEELCKCDESETRPHLKGEHYGHPQLIFANKIQDTRFVKGQRVSVYGEGHEFRKCTVH